MLHNGKSHLAFFRVFFLIPWIEGEGERKGKSVGLGFVLEHYLQQQVATAFHLVECFADSKGSGKERKVA